MKKIKETPTAYAVSDPASVASIAEQVREKDAPLLVLHGDQMIAAVIPISDYMQFSLWQKAKSKARKRQPLTWLEKQERLMDREVAAYARMRSKLLQTHKDKWIAIFKGKLVDSGDDEDTLTERVYAKFGYRTMLIRQVTETERVYHVNSPRVISR
jgi:hypothetical protein